MEIRIQTSEELNKLLDALAIQVVDANIYFKLYSDITQIIPEYSREYAQSGTFWYLSIRALQEAYLHRLCRVFDQESNSLQFVNLLDTIKSNTHLFNHDNFAERLKDNPFVESLAEDARIPSLEQLEKDIEFSSTRNPLVNKLMIWRNTVYAHSGAKVTLGKNAILVNNPILNEEIEELLNKSFEFMNRYLHLFKATTWSRQIVGHDDFRSIFKFIRVGLQKYDSDIEQKLLQWQKPSSE